MKCEEVQLRMIDYLDKVLDEAGRSEIEKHLETCEVCLDELRETQRILNRVAGEEMEKPDESLRINFYHMLHNQIKKDSDLPEIAKLQQVAPWYARRMYRVAAGVALLITGTLIGLLMHGSVNNSYAANELKQLHSEISDLKKATMFTMLQDESSSDRIQAVRYVEDLDNPDQNVIDALVRTLNTDKNVNVRMAAAYALSRFTNQRIVCDSLVKSLSNQTDPILQVTLINILAEKKEKSALKPVQEIIANKNTLKEVRAVAENSLRVLI
jgi:hypothetical protein